MNGNPLRNIITDEQFQFLMDKGFLNERAVRDFYIRKKFYKLKRRHSPKKIISELREEFPYLSLETIRKIVYSRTDCLINSD
jgi:hypothetical protein